MPVVFAPADPYSEAISQGYGATEQWNKEYPVMAGLAEHIGQMNLRSREFDQSQAQQAAIVSAQNNQRSAAESRQMQFAAQQQGEQFRQHQILQQMAQEHADRSQFLHWALQGQAISQADVIQQNRRNQAVSAIMKAVEDGTLDQTEAGPMILRLKTGIDLFDERRKQEQANNQASLEKLHLQQAANQQAILQKNVELQGRTAEQNTVTTLDPKMEQEERARLAPKYQALAAVIGTEAAQSAYDNEVKMAVIGRGGAQRMLMKGISSHGTAEWHALDKPTTPGHDKDLFESTLKHAEAEDKRWQTDRDHYAKEYADEMKAVRKVHQDRGDVNDKEPSAETLYGEVEQNLARRGISPPGPRPTMPRRPTASPSSAPASTEGQNAQAQAEERGPSTSFSDPIRQRIDTSRHDDVTKAGLRTLADKVQAILNKPQRTEQDLRELMDYKKQLKDKLGE